MIPKMIMDPRNAYAGQFYVSANVSLDGIPRYLHSDAIVRGSTLKDGEPSGYFATQSEAQAAIDAYKEAQGEAIAANEDRLRRQAEAAK